MAAIKGRDTKPEIQVRKLLWNRGFRYRLHDRSLPGSPDIVFRGKRKVVFVHGCYWHRHKDCKKAYQVKTNVKFWESKFARNVERDSEVQEALNLNGWEYFIVWECELIQPEEVVGRLVRYLKDDGS